MGLLAEWETGKNTYKGIGSVFYIGNSFQEGEKDKDILRSIIFTYLKDFNRKKAF